MRILTVLGARPQFIKAAAVSRAFQRDRPDVTETIVHTGQHYDANMSDVFFDDLDIPRPAHNLGIGGGSHGQNTGRMLEHLETLIVQNRPDWMLVFGDTDSTLAGALVAAKAHIPLIHVEAGLRSFNRRMPEEINRVLTDHVSDLLFAPTQTAKDNLRREGIADARIHVFGDVMLDAALFYRDRARQPDWFGALGITGDFALCTLHRAENTSDPAVLEAIFRGLAAAPFPVILPVHPRTRKTMHALGLSWPDTVHAVDPVGYLEMVWLESHCRIVLTDSGGVQKEAFFHRKPCLTLRAETEWVELVAAGWNRLVAHNPDAIAAGLTTDWVSDHAPDLYGHGDAARRIVMAIR